MSNVIKYQKKIVASGGGSVPASLITDVTTLKNNVYKVIYWAQVSSGTSGTITIPTGATIILGQLPGNTNVLTSVISSGFPTDTSPVTSGGSVVTATLDAGGNYTLSGTPSAYPIALIYVLTIKAIDYGNLTTGNIIEYYQVTQNLGSIGGSIAINQIAYGSGSNTIQGSSDLIYDGTNFIYKASLLPTLQNSNVQFGTQKVLQGNLYASTGTTSYVPTFTEYVLRNTDGVALTQRGAVGMLSSGEVNMSINMDYTTAKHLPYDTTQTMIWSFLGGGSRNAFGIQFVPANQTPVADYYTSYGVEMFSVQAYNQPTTGKAIAGFSTVTAADYNFIDINNTSSVTGGISTIRNTGGNLVYTSNNAGGRHYFSSASGTTYVWIQGAAGASFNADAKLSTQAAGFATYTNASGQWFMGTGFNTSDNTTWGLSTFASGTNIITALSTGNVGIGINVPTSKFHVVGAGLFTTQITTPILLGSSSSGGTLTLQSTSNATKGKIIFGTGSTINGTFYDEVNNNFILGGTSAPASARRLTVLTAFSGDGITMQQGTAADNFNCLFYNSSATLLGGWGLTGTSHGIIGDDAVGDLDFRVQGHSIRFSTNSGVSTAWSIDSGGQLIGSLASKGITLKSGSNCKIGTGALVGGTTTITNTSVTSASVIFLQDTTSGSLTNVGTLSVVAGSGNFVVTSTNPLDTSTFNYIIFETN